jgi:N-acylneuraminate cytidylyltransferase
VKTPSIVALIPARGGSKRISRKNMKLLGSKPLIAWTISAAKSSGIFIDIVVSTDDEETMHLASNADVSVHRRQRDHATDDSPDIEWVTDLMRARNENCFAILRPTSPFRTGATIRRAWEVFLDQQPCDSLRAMREVREHPGKMWMRAPGLNRCYPLFPQTTLHFGRTVPWHSSPTQTLPAVLVQDASLEMAWSHVISKTHSITGDSVCPFYTFDWEGFDINTQDDWEKAEAHVATTLLAAL